MPSLPFTFEDLTNFNPQSAAEEQRVADEAQKGDMSMHSSQNKAQNFLSSKLSKIKQNFASKEGLLDVAMTLNPVTRVVDMGSKFFGGPGIEKGFTEGVNMTGETRVPPLMF